MTKLRGIQVGSIGMALAAVVGCGESRGAPPPPPAPSLATPTLAGTIGQRPFVGRSALLVKVNAIATGTLQFLDAARGGGVLSLDAVTTNPGLDASGSVRGTIPFTACS